VEEEDVALVAAFVAAIAVEVAVPVVDSVANHLMRIGSDFLDGNYCPSPLHSGAGEACLLDYIHIVVDVEPWPVALLIGRRNQESDPESDLESDLEYLIPSVVLLSNPLLLSRLCLFSNDRTMFLAS